LDESPIATKHKNTGDAMNRKQRRTLQHKASKEEQALSEKVTLFNKLPNACDACHSPFDKQDRDMVFSWTVIIREETESVRLFCPSCVEDIKKKLNKSKESQ
jgi:hypothetical protein